MKKIEAIIKPFRLEEMKTALNSVGIERMTVSEVKSIGPQNVRTGIFRGHEFTVDSLPEIKIELILSDDRLNQVLAAVRKVVQAAKPNDDRVFVSNIEDALQPHPELREEHLLQAV